MNLWIIQLNYKINKFIKKYILSFIYYEEINIIEENEVIQLEDIKKKQSINKNVISFQN